MNIKIFTIPILGGEQLQEEMNHFLQQKIVLSIENHLIDTSNASYWTFCVRFKEPIKSKKKKTG